MKRVGNLYEKIISLENLKLADKRAKKGKKNQYGVIKHLKDREQNLIALNEELKNKTFSTSEYKIFKISDGKEREIHSLPFYPDRIVHHSIINVLEPIFMKLFTADTYSCIKGKGVHKASYKLRDYLKADIEGTKYCLKIDIRKFYPSIDNEILKTLLRKKFKDKDLLFLLDNIINSTKGIPIGSYTSQFLANFYLTYFDHWIKEDLKIKYYLKYCDDMVILSDSKEQLWGWFYKIKSYLKEELNLEIKDNYQVFPVEDRGIDWCGYKHYHTHTLIRKSIKRKYIKNKNKKTHWGWIKHGDCINLKNKYENAGI